MCCQPRVRVVCAVLFPATDSHTTRAHCLCQTDIRARCSSYGPTKHPQLDWTCRYRQCFPSKSSNRLIAPLLWAISEWCCHLSLVPRLYNFVSVGRADLIRKWVSSLACLKGGKCCRCCRRRVHQPSRQPIKQVASNVGRQMFVVSLTRWVSNHPSASKI